MKIATAGHEIQFGVRNTLNPEVIALAGALHCRYGTIEEAIAFGDVVLFAIPGEAMEETLKQHGHSLHGKMVIDAANRIGSSVMNSAIAFQRYAPGAILYRAFNSIGWEMFENPMFGETKADLFYCGADGSSRASMEQIIIDVGLNPVRVGDMGQVGIVDSIGGLWFALAFGQKHGRQLAFKVLSR